jgi:hypothetical protein
MGRDSMIRDRSSRGSEDKGNSLYGLPLAGGFAMILGHNLASAFFWTARVVMPIALEMSFVVTYISIF